MTTAHDLDPAADVDEEPQGQRAATGAGIAVCEVCGSTDGSATVRDVPMKTVACDSCWAPAVTPSPQPEQVPFIRTLEQLIHAPLPDLRDGTATTCGKCGTPASWHKTLNGKWVLIEDGDYPAPQIPDGHRWRIAGDGTALNVGRANPSDLCRITHFDVCPSKLPSPDSPVLYAVWKHNRDAALP